MLASRPACQHSWAEGDCCVVACVWNIIGTLTAQFRAGGGGLKCCDNAFVCVETEVIMNGFLMKL